MKTIVAFIFALLAGLASAEPYPGPTPCLPAEKSASESPADWVQPKENVAWIGSPRRDDVNSKGAWVRWHCAEVGTGRLVTVTYVTTQADWSNVGGRLRTIVNATDPLKSLQTLPNRITMLPLSDPLFAPILATIGD